MNSISLNQNTCKDLNLFDFLKSASKFSGVELNFKSIKENLSDNTKLKDILEVLSTFDLTVTSIFKLKDFNLCSDHNFSTKIIPKFKKMIDFCYKLESDLVIIQPSFFTESQASEIIPRRRTNSRTTKRLTELSKTVKDSDIKIGFEFLALQDSSVRSLQETKDILQPLESLENIGYVIDCFHFIKSEGDFNSLKDIKEYIYIVQLCNLRFTSIDDLDNSNDSERNLLDDGDFEIRKFLENLRKLRYRKNYSIEVSPTNCIKNLFKEVLNYLRR